jgi:hypothetical protein
MLKQFTRLTGVICMTRRTFELLGSVGNGRWVCGLTLVDYFSTRPDDFIAIAHVAISAAQPATAQPRLLFLLFDVSPVLVVSRPLLGMAPRSAIACYAAPGP